MDAATATDTAPAKLENQVQLGRRAVPETSCACKKEMVEADWNRED